ncbi:hypothetical protein D3C76_1712830 [compost metagenome]
MFVIENIFKYLDQIGHEIDFIYEAKLSDINLYNKDVIDGIEGETKYKAVWKPLFDFTNNPREKLVPDGLLELLINKNDEETSVIKHKGTSLASQRR